MFNDDVAVKNFKGLHKIYGWQTGFETGTHTGWGALAMSAICPNVVTVEINPEFRDQAKQRWKEAGYIESPVGHDLLFQKDGHSIYSYLGSSPDILLAALKSGMFPEPHVAYLDAHWPNCVLRQELQVLIDLGIRDVTLICHDFFVPGQPNLRGDEYEGKKLCFDYIADLLNKINPNYMIEHNSESSTGIGILYALP